MGKQTLKGIRYWERTGGARPIVQIQRYQTIKGDSDFVAKGTKPKCPICGGKRLKAVLEVEQLGLLSSKFDLVMRCQAKECGQMISYRYEIDYNYPESEE